jgi:hypothetical protein
VLAAQKLLSLASIQTTGDIYVNWDIDQLASTMVSWIRNRSLSLPQIRHFAAQMISLASYQRRPSFK